MNIPELCKMRADNYDRISLLCGACFLLYSCLSWPRREWTENVFWANSIPHTTSGSQCRMQMFAHTKAGLPGAAFCQTSLNDPTYLCEHANVSSTAQLYGHHRSKLGTWRRQKCHRSSQAGSHLPQRPRSQVSL